MPTYTRSAGRQLANLFPAWRQAMTQTDRLYYVGTQTPENAPALPGMPTQFGSSPSGTYGSGWDVMSGYSGSTLIEDAGGPFGIYIHGTGGHNRVQNQILGFNLNLDDPTYTWWQQPTWKTSDTGGANFYYSPSEQAALIAGPRGLAAFIENPNGYGESFESVARWDRQFPVAYNGWIFPRKMTTGQMGDGTPHGLRYATHAYIPASMTGTDPMLLATLGPQGPFVQGHIALGDGSLTTATAPGNQNTSEVDWFDPSVLVSGKRRWPYYLKNIRTGAWTVHQWQPLNVGRGGFSNTPICVFPDLKRAYVIGTIGSGYGYWYLDFSAGFAGHTVSGTTTGLLGTHRYADSAYSAGDPLGRHFAVSLSDSGSHTTKLVVYNFDAGTSFHVDLAAAGFSYDVQDNHLNLSYDARRQRVYMTQRNATTWRPEVWVINVPADITNTAGWTATLRTLALDNAGMATTHFDQRDDRQAYTYGKARYMPRLDCILIPFTSRRALAFRPS